ncbi:hypothetical protein A11A3_04760 [Alcanivorax hongdengensis A-11-3]|uniref:L,D-TPase catalytic domain-containing protein n=1 Tax=Alcanivorax hongdengensis A-11-3 TaxID=1177179 RepID=L0WGH8_9GAMM|nr:hypothetical protein A11A3_04760 [Alcanivorax hongdengensis A-11-3]
MAGQWLELAGPTTQRFPVSTAAVGAGQGQGSGATPRGRHLVRARFGDGLPAGAVFEGRKFNGQIHSPTLAAQHPDRDWILSRILWLGGLEPGHNQGGDVDSFRRFIYIHGTPDSEPMGVPASHGCIRMRNQDVITLFDQIGVGTQVNIV